MGIAASSLSSVDLAASTWERLRAMGFDTGPASITESGDPGQGLREAIDSAARSGIAVTIANRPEHPREAETILAITAPDDKAASLSPIAIVVFPARSTPAPGPVVVVSPAESVSVYEVYVGAAVGAAQGSRVVHLNGRGVSASFAHSGIASRLLVRSAAPEWRESVLTSLPAAIRALSTPPAAIVAAVPPESRDATRIISDHPDADVILVFDRAHAHHGARVAHQVSSMVELAFDLGALPATPAEPPAEETDDAPARVPGSPTDDVPDANPDLPAILASDVVHIRLTAEALELTNRTSQTVRLGAALGSAADPSAALAHLEITLDPREARAVPSVTIAALREIEPPRAVMRHWSHESEVVYEGGQQRILELSVEVLDRGGEVRAAQRFHPGNGLDFFVTARDLLALLDRSAPRAVLPEPVRASVGGTGPANILGTLASALAVGSRALEARQT